MSEALARARRRRRASVTLVLVAALALLPEAAALSARAIPVRFAREHVVLHPGAEDCRVEGVYELTHIPTRGLALDYPFPADSALGPPVVLAVFATVDGRPVRVGVRQVGGSTSRLDLDASGARCELRVLYRQPLFARRAVYLLTTARAWGEPLERATFEVDWPDSLGSPRFSLPLAVAARAPGKTLYRFEAAPFLPDTDLVVTW